IDPDGRDGKEDKEGQEEDPNYINLGPNPEIDRSPGACKGASPPPGKACAGRTVDKKGRAVYAWEDADGVIGGASDEELSAFQRVLRGLGISLHPETLKALQGLSIVMSVLSPITAAVAKSVK